VRCGSLPADVRAALHALIEADRVELLAGVPEPVDVPRDDGSEQRIFRCPSCHVAVFSQYGGTMFVLHEVDDP
jgi:hypothetical protein